MSLLYIIIIEIINGSVLIFIAYNNNNKNNKEIIYKIKYSWLRIRQLS